MRKWSLVIIALALLTTSLALILHKPQKSVQNQQSQQTVATVAPVVAPTPATLLAAVNAERAKYQVAPLTEDQRLDSTAQAKACDEVNNHYIAHYSPSGIRGDDLVKQALGNPAGYYDENLTQPTPVTVDQSMYNWINSPEHHKEMINPTYTITGFGVCGNEVVEHFYGA